MAHSYIIGQSGTGKSTLMKQQALDRIAAGDGVCFIDPHGQDTDDLLRYIPARRRKDVALFDPSQFTIPWYPLQSENRPAFTAGSFAESLKDAWGYADVPTPRMDICIYSAVAALIEADEPLLGFYLLLTSSDYRQHVIGKLEDRVIQDYWSLLDRMTERDRLQMVDTTLNKVSYLMADPCIAAMFAKRHGTLDLKDILTGKVLLVRLPQSSLGIQKVATLGSLLLTQLHHTALLRDPSVPFHLFIDEFHHFARGTLKEMYSGIRKFGVSLTVAHQYLDQVDGDLLAAVLGNSAVRYVFRVSREDAQRIDVQKRQYDLYDLPNFRARVARSESVFDLEVNEIERKAGDPGKVIAHTRRHYHREPGSAVNDFLARF
jgi:hypothetical protein